PGFPLELPGSHASAPLPRPRLQLLELATASDTSVVERRNVIVGGTITAYLPAPLRKARLSVSAASFLSIKLIAPSDSLRRCMSLASGATRPAGKILKAAPKSSSFAAEFAE